MALLPCGNVLWTRLPAGVTISNVPVTEWPRVLTIRTNPVTGSHAEHALLLSRGSSAIRACVDLQILLLDSSTMDARTAAIGRNTGSFSPVH